MYIELKSENGKFVIGKNSAAKLLSVSGLGLPQKEVQTITYEGQPGQTTLSETDQYRTITLSFDFEGQASEAQRLYKIIYKPVDILFYGENMRRKISGRVSDMQDLEKVISGQLWNAAIQFVCDNPYFEDFTKVSTNIFGRSDNLPNNYTDEEPKIQLPTIATSRFYQSNVKNRGDFDIFPTIKIKNTGTGSSESVTVSNLTTGQRLKLNHNIPQNQTVTINVDGRKITDDSGNMLLKSLDDTTLLKDFKLIPGYNLISISEEEKSGAVLDCVVEFTNKYLTAVI